MADRDDLCSTHHKAKLTYDDAEERIRGAKRARGEVMVKYRCADCHWWHLSHADKHSHGGGGGLRRKSRKTRMHGSKEMRRRRSGGR